jgi:K+-sensing histidine kinase KdpD
MYLKDPISKNDLKSYPFLKKNITISGEKDSNRGILSTEENKAFLSIISHNIKNPFGALLGYSDLILEDYQELCDAEKVLYVSELKKTAKHTYKYIERFFEWLYYKTDKIKTNFKVINLREVVTRSIESLLLNSEYLGEIYFSIDPSIQIYCDSDSISKAFYYIIENSLNYSAPNGRISINAGIKENFVEIKIEDNGSGISEETMNKLFDVSKNIVPSPNGGENGTGLGLILVEQIMKINNASIRIESEDKKGTTVFVRLQVDSKHN